MGCGWILFIDFSLKVQIYFFRCGSVVCIIINEPQMDITFPWNFTDLKEKQLLANLKMIRLIEEGQKPERKRFKLSFYSIKYLTVKCVRSHYFALWFELPPNREEFLNAIKINEPIEWSNADKCLCLNFFFSEFFRIFIMVWFLLVDLDRLLILLCRSHSNNDDDSGGGGSS